MKKIQREREKQHRTKRRKTVEIFFVTLFQPFNNIKCVKAKKMSFIFVHQHKEFFYLNFERTRRMKIK